MRTTAGQIRDIVKDHLQMDIAKKTRRRDYSDARAIYYKLCKDFTDETLRSIGISVDRDHSTVLHGIRNIFPVVDQEPYRVMYESIKQNTVSER